MMYSSFTSESVCAGHPDKVCDQISDAVVDAALLGDKYSRVAVENLVTKEYLFMAGEVTTRAKINYEKVARDVIKKLGYTDPKLKFTFKSPITIAVGTQSKDIAVGVDQAGAGDQGMMFGFACQETAELMPLPIMLAHRLVMLIDRLREEAILPYLRPDGKAQITVNYKNGKPQDIEHIVLAVPHKETVGLKKVKNDLYKLVVVPTLERYGYKYPSKNLVVNGTGVWHFSGPAADTGVTGRKIVVDTYGAYASVGGGCFSGKDPTKVDRSAAYAARYLAKNIVAHKLATKCEVRLAYFIGAKRPVMQEIETYGTSKKSDKIIYSFMKKILNTSVASILETLDLRRPIYFKTASYGHFGREEFPWEKIAQV